jgi:hypothetical protein
LNWSASLALRDYGARSNLIALHDILDPKMDKV